MSSQRTLVGTVVTLLTAALGLGLAACTPDENPTEPSTAASASATALAFGPFPGRTTIFVDVDNTTGNEDGSQAHPFNTLSEGIAAAGNGDVVGLAPGVYAELFGPELTPNYVIGGLKNFKLLGMGVGQTSIRGDHSFSLIRVQNGASGLIGDLTIERGGRLQNSDGGGIQVIGRPDSVALTVQNVLLQDNEAVN